MTSLKRTDRNRMRAMNTKLVLDAVRAAAPTSQADLIRATRLSTGTIVSIVRDLRRRGLVVETGRGASRGGRCPTLLRPDTTAALVLSCQLGSSTAVAAVLDVGANLLSRRELAVQPERGPEAFMPALVACLHEQLRSLGGEARRVAGLGLSLHGPVDTDRGVMLFSSHLGWQDVPFRDELQGLLGVPVLAEAETRAIAFAEQCWGAGRGVRDFVLIELDTGIGMVQVLDGRPCRGRHSLAGELGFTRWTVANQPTTGSPAACTLEDLASLRVLCRHAGRQPSSRTSRRPAQGLAVPDVDRRLRALLAAAARGDVHAAQLFDAALSALALAIANVITVLDPELVLLCGRLVSGAGNALLDPLRQRVQAHLLGKPDRTPRLEGSTLGPDAAVLGAAGLVIEHFYSVDSLADGQGRQPP